MAWFVLVESNTTGSGRLFCSCARDLGLRPVMLTRDPSRYPYVAADGIEHRIVDTTDPDALLEACASLRDEAPIAGVTSSSEYSVAIAGEVARALGLPHPDPDAVRACRDKSRQREILHAAGVSGARFAAARSVPDAVSFADDLGLPVVVKPVAGSGSIATRLCTTPDEVRAAASAVLDADLAALGLPPQDAVLIEEYLVGEEFSVETLDDQVVGVTRKHLGPAPHFVETGHDFPALPDHRESIAATAVDALRALGLGWGPAHVELRLTAGGPRIVEVNPRLAGGMIPRMVQEATGIDLILQTVRRAAGLPVSLDPTRTKAASIRFLVAKRSGRLAGITGLSDARALPGVVEAAPIREPGHDVVLRHSFHDRLAYVIATAGTPPEAAAAAEAALATLAADIEPEPAPDANPSSWAATPSAATPSAAAPEISVAIIGLGSRGLGVLERVVTLARGVDAPVRVEVIDPTCSGAGVHATGQPDYLLLNTTCAQVSMFPDALSVGDDLGEPGPSLYDWVTERGLRLADDGFTVGHTGRPIRGTDFLPRRVLGEYLGWVLDRVVTKAPPHTRITLHRAEATDLTRGPDGAFHLTLSDGTAITTRYAFLTTGYTPNTAVRIHERLIDAPYPLPSQLNAVAPGEDVAIGGFGLSAMDVMSCLTVGRGGRFVTEDRTLRYEPSGAEPVMYFYSRSGVPCRARPQIMNFGPKHEPVAFTTAAIDGLRASRREPLDFEADLLPLILTEVRIAYRLCEARLAGGTAERDLRAALRGREVNDLLDELDARLGPFDARAAFDGGTDMLLDSSESYQKWLADLISRDLADGALGFAGSPVKAGLDIMRELRDTFRYAVDFGGLTAESLDAFTTRIVPAVNRAVVGPQYERHLELLALMAAGLAHVPFGPAPSVTWNGAAWTLASTRLATPYEKDVAWVVNAQVPPPSVHESASPLLASMHRQGMIRRHRPSSGHVPGIDVDRDMHPLDAAGHPHPDVWVLGPLCEGATFYNNLVPSPGVYSRPVADAHRCVRAMFAHAL
jgi:biotin carboxylase/uncharacterized NAD(P)/FAD-binding protein YdhS